VVVAVGLLGDQLAQENDATAAGTVAVVNFAWPVAALAEVRRRLVAQEYGRILVMSSSPRSASVATPISTAAPRPGSIDSVRNGRLVGRHRSHVAVAAPGVVRTRMTKGQAPLPSRPVPTKSRLRDEGTGDQRPGYLESTDPALRLCDVAPSPQADLAQGRRALPGVVVVLEVVVETVLRSSLSRSDMVKKSCAQK